MHHLDDLTCADLTSGANAFQNHIIHLSTTNKLSLCLGIAGEIFDCISDRYNILVLGIWNMGDKLPFKGTDDLWQKNSIWNNNKNSVT